MTTANTNSLQTRIPASLINGYIKIYFESSRKVLFDAAVFLFKTNNKEENQTTNALLT